MAGKTRTGEVNKSQLIRDLLTANPEIKAKEVAVDLGKQGLKVSPNMFYFIKGKMKGRKGRQKQARKMVENVTATMGVNGAAPAKTGDVIATILKVKHLAAEVGGLKKLKALVEALGE